jgi:hypothetical protein
MGNGTLITERSRTATPVAFAFLPKIVIADRLTPIGVPEISPDVDPFNPLGSPIKTKYVPEGALICLE